VPLIHRGSYLEQVEEEQQDRLDKVHLENNQAISGLFHFAASLLD